MFEQTFLDDMFGMTGVRTDRQMFGMTSVRTHKGTNIQTSWANMCSDTQRDKLTDAVSSLFSQLITVKNYNFTHFLAP